MESTKHWAGATSYQARMPASSAALERRSDFRANFSVMLAAFLVGVGLMGLKFYGYWVTGSSAILSDALESIINVVASGFGLASIIMSAMPADESHPYGHGKIEFFSSGFEGALILIAAVGIFHEGLKQILSPHDLPNLESGLLFLLAAGLGNLVLGLALLRVGKRTMSIVLEADGKHLLTDVYTSGAVLVGLAMVEITGWFRFDGIIACLAALNIVYWGCRLVRQAFRGLMDASDPQLLDEICDLLVRHKKALWIDVHRLRAWKSGKQIRVDFHLVLPKDLAFEDGHGEVKQLEKIFSDHFGGTAEILIHLDPCAQKACAVCNLTPCAFRLERPARLSFWDRQTLTGEAVGK